MCKTIIYSNKVYKGLIEKYIEENSLHYQVLNVEDAPIQEINRLLYDAFKD